MKTVSKTTTRAVAALTLGCALLVWTQVRALEVPDVSGDQLIFLYDARADRIPFLGVANTTDERVFVEVAFYDAGLDSRVADAVVEILPAANVIIDPKSFADGGAIGHAGLALVTPVEGPDDRRAVVPPGPLTGVFTLANLALGSGFGQNPFARSAVDGDGKRPPSGTVVDGADVAYERFAPEVLVIPVYFNPQTLEPPELDGNRVLLATFQDDYGVPFGVSGRSDNAMAVFFDASGKRLITQPALVNGVLLSNLQTLADGITLDSSGKVFFDVDPGEGNYLGLYSQSLGTFAAGQRLPSVALIPTGAGS
ncbi:MAG: hypothetical protein P8R42_15205 [Candidatus Binatia bacterium]|nr:hypothetical protein [Candidatus Binatia bacterium]